jgi:cholest-4-en-3-one 26-monooxygenase
MGAMAELLSDLELIDPGEFARNGYPHAAWRRLRREAPVFRSERSKPHFWALVRHADIVGVSRQPQRFASAPRFQYIPESEGESGEFVARTIISMDPPDHRRYREIASPRFTPRALRALEAEVERIAGDLLEELARESRSGECDFVAAFAAPLPIAVIAHLLGLPREDWPSLYAWTNRIVSASDPQYRDAGATPDESRLRATQELFAYFADLAARRRAAPQGDLVSLLGQASVGGAPLSQEDLLSYCLILVAAGNETTRNAISGGLLAFLEHPEEWRRVQREPGLLPRAVEEILRWTSPVVQMARTATEDLEVGGTRIRAGELLVLFYPSANRDEAVFSEPERFCVDRHPNRHLAFGVGEHFCLGAHLARMELAAAFRQLARRLERIEPAGEPVRLRSSLVGGIKELPIRYALRPASTAGRS